MTAHKFYTVHEVAELTGMSRAWVWKAAREGKIAHHRFGGSYRWTDDDLIALATQSAVKPSGPPRLTPLRRGGKR